MTYLSGSGRIMWNSQLAELLEEGEHQPPTKDRTYVPQREF